MLGTLPVKISNVRELAGNIVHRPLLVPGSIHPSTVYWTNHVFSPVLLLLSKQNRRNSKKYAVIKVARFI
jgi:hypothetical protein